MELAVPFGSVGPFFGALRLLSLTPNSGMRVELGVSWVRGKHVYQCSVLLWCWASRKLPSNEETRKMKDTPPTLVYP